MKIKGYTKNPKIAAHKLVNLDLAFEFMKKEEVKLIGIGSYNELSCTSHLGSEVYTKGKGGIFFPGTCPRLTVLSSTWIQ